ncbi:unnamed protein product [Euphydryas editha]|uniref:G-protein coupled receptors family 1 profile domain-containing protein n=1 Tax=Euphydryas editha TaxID=104508 RepID=A0AAU9V7P4_EUPED|nr:unnamed protein product [Euphydryas editha]
MFITISAHTSKRIAKIIIVFIWILALTLAAPMAMSWEVIMIEDQEPVSKLFYEKPFCAPTEFGSHSLAIYRLLLYIFQYIIPLCVITFAYAHMAMKLWGARAPGNAQEIRDANQMKNKKKVIKMLVLVVALFALCWLPLQTYMLLQSFFPSINEYKYINVLFFCFDWLAMSNSCYNPFIYAIYNEKFKKEFKQRFTFRQKRNRFTNDSYEDGQSYRTRILSIRSTNDRMCSTRKSINITPSDTLKTSKDPCHCMKNKKRELGKENQCQSQKPHLFNSFKNRARHDSHVQEFPRSRFGDNDLPIGDERVSELYIFPNSSIVEFTDVLNDHKV